MLIQEQFFRNVKKKKKGWINDLQVACRNLEFDPRTLTRCALPCNNKDLGTSIFGF